MYPWVTCSWSPEQSDQNPIERYTDHIDHWRTRGNATSPLLLDIKRGQLAACCAWRPAVACAGVPHSAAPTTLSSVQHPTLPIGPAAQ